MADLALGRRGADVALDCGQAQGETTCNIWLDRKRDLAKTKTAHGSLVLCAPKLHEAHARDQIGNGGIVITSASFGGLASADKPLPSAIKSWSKI